MRQRTVRLSVVVLGLAFAAVVTRVEGRQGQAVDPALKQAVEARAAAMMSGDVNVYEPALLDDAYFVSTDGTITSKQDRVAALKRNKPTPFQVSEERYRMSGDMAMHAYRSDGIDQQGQKQVRRFMEVWVKQAGAWKVAAIQATTIEKP